MRTVPCDIENEVPRIAEWLDGHDSQLAFKLDADHLTMQIFSPNMTIEMPFDRRKLPDAGEGALLLVVKKVVKGIKHDDIMDALKEVL